MSSFPILGYFPGGWLLTLYGCLNNGFSWWGQFGRDRWSDTGGSCNKIIIVPAAFVLLVELGDGGLNTITFLKTGAKYGD